MNALRSITNWLSRGRTAVIGLPYVWLLVFFLLPFLIVLKISVSESEGVSFKDVLTVKDGLLQLTVKFANYVFLTQDDLYFKTYISSIKYAAVTTLLCLAHWLPVRLFHGARQGDHSARLADARDAAVLDFVPAARLRLERPADRTWLGGRSVDRPSHRPPAARGRPDSCLGQST